MADPHAWSLSLTNLVVLIAVLLHVVITHLRTIFAWVYWLALCGLVSSTSRDSVDAVRGGSRVHLLSSLFVDGANDLIVVSVRCILVVVLVYFDGVSKIVLLVYDDLVIILALHYRVSPVRLQLVLLDA